MFLYQIINSRIANKCPLKLILRPPSWRKKHTIEWWFQLPTKNWAVHIPSAPCWQEMRRWELDNTRTEIRETQTFWIEKSCDQTKRSSRFRPIMAYHDLSVQPFCSRTKTTWFPMKINAYFSGIWSLLLTTYEFLWVDINDAYLELWCSDSIPLIL